MIKKFMIIAVVSLSGCVAYVQPVPVVATPPPVVVTPIFVDYGDVYRVPYRGVIYGYYWRADYGCYHKIQRCYPDNSRH